MRTIAVIGSTNIDLVVVTEHLPREGETVLGHDYRVVCGGKGATQAIAAARLGARVHMVGCVGRDGYGRLALRNLEFPQGGLSAAKPTLRGFGARRSRASGSCRWRAAPAPGER